MSFSQLVKEEIATSIIKNKHLARYELEAFFHTTIVYIDDTSARFRTENVLVAKRFFEYIKLVYGISLMNEITKQKTLKKRRVYEYEINEQVIVDDIHKALEVKVDVKDISTEHKKSYIKATFLAVGSILNPEKEYHLEFTYNSYEYINVLIDMLEEFEVHPKIIVRKKTYVVYIKDSEQIISVLSILSAYKGLLEIENIKILKDIKNNINREVNCETANLKRTINAAIIQAEAIEKIEKLRGLESLNDKLREVAEERLNNKEASLSEISEILGLSKSCVNHRFRKIINIANSI